MRLTVHLKEATAAELAALRKSGQLLIDQLEVVLNYHLAARAGHPVDQAQHEAALFAGERLLNNLDAYHAIAQTDYVENFSPSVRGFARALGVPTATAQSRREQILNPRSTRKVLIFGGDPADDAVPEGE